MKKHDVKTEDNDVTKGLHDVKTEDDIGTNEEQMSCPSETFIALQKRVSAQMKDFNRKIELGRYVKLVVDTNGYIVNRLNNDMKEAMNTYVLHGETKEYMYKCTYCSYVSKRKSNVKRHQKAMHYYHE